MYRYLIPVLLCASAVMPAPQQNSNITYVKLQPDLEQTQLVLNPLQRESRIEKVPLTIPAVVATQPTDSNETTKATQTVNKQPTYNYSDRIYSIKTKPKTTTSTEKNVAIDEVDTESVNSGDKNITQENPDTNNFDIVPAESILNDRVATNDSTGLSIEADTTQSDEFVTEKYEEDTTVTITTVIGEETTRAPTRRQLPKLSYFGKSTTGSFSQNLIAHPGKRRFRTRCRCEKIWNCTNIQITVPRCPEEYFLCC